MFGVVCMFGVVEMVRFVVSKIESLKFSFSISIQALSILSLFPGFTINAFVPSSCFCCRVNVVLFSLLNVEIMRSFHCISNSRFCLSFPFLMRWWTLHKSWFCYFVLVLIVIVHLSHGVFVVVVLAAGLSYHLIEWLCFCLDLSSISSSRFTCYNSL